LEHFVAVATPDRFVGVTTLQAEELKGPLREPWATHIIGNSPAVRQVIDLSHRVAASRSATVFLVGETGTGKELFARGVHAASPRTADPFVAINCAAIPESLLETELFGHEAGAFTDARTLKKGLFEIAGSGTIFLDEVAELPLKLQSKLLRVVEDRKFRRVGGHAELNLLARIVTGTNVPLEPAVLQGTFRADLYYRLNVVRIELPPLRERHGDVRLLAGYFVKRHADGDDRPLLRISDAALDVLDSYGWPGNIRELRNVIERAVVVCAGDIIEPHHISLQRRSLVPIAEIREGVTIHIPPEGKSLDVIMHEAIHATIGITGGNLSAAARLLGISRPTLARKLREHGFVRRTILASA
jgi:transcriptional regulator with PAS, ATPase and Fis domain